MRLTGISDEFGCGDIAAAVGSVAGAEPFGAGGRSHRSRRSANRAGGETFEYPGLNTDKKMGGRR